MTNDEIQNLLRKADEAGPFQPGATYDPDGDCIEFLASDESFYGERIDPLVTVYYGRESHAIIGSLIKGVSQFVREVLQRAPGFKIEIQDGRIKLEHFFTARLWSAPADPRDALVITYKKLREVAERSGVEADIDEMAWT